MRAANDDPVFSSDTTLLRSKLVELKRHFDALTEDIASMTLVERKAFAQTELFAQMRELADMMDRLVAAIVTSKNGLN